MVAVIDDGGQAFPWATGKGSYTEGMTLRDWFAAHAPITYAEALKSLQDEGVGFTSYGAIFKRLCQMQLAYADAMLAERKATRETIVG